MAILKVTGTVKRIFFNGKGVEIVEKFVGKDKAEKTRSYTAWFEKAPNFELGDVTTISGMHSAVIKLWTNPDGSPKLDNFGKQGQSVDVSLNNAQVVKSVVAPVVDDSPF